MSLIEFYPAFLSVIVCMSIYFVFATTRCESTIPLHPQCIQSNAGKSPLHSMSQTIQTTVGTFPNWASKHIVKVCSFRPPAMAHPICHSTGNRRSCSGRCRQWCSKRRRQKAHQIEEGPGRPVVVVADHDDVMLAPSCLAMDIEITSSLHPGSPKF